MTQYEITVVDVHTRKWQGLERETRKLAQVVPLKVAQRWMAQRRDMTAGLRQRIKQARN